MPSGYSFVYKGRIKGDMTLAVRTARPPIRGAYSGLVCGNGLSFTFYIEPILKYGLFGDVMRLYQNVVEYSGATYGRASLGVLSTARFHKIDDPEYSRVRPVELNGVTIQPFDKRVGGGKQLYTCLPRFESWLNVLGREYVELLGRDRLLALDVYSAHEDKDGRVWLQITERPEQMHLDETFDHVQKLMASLDASDIFCRRWASDEERRRSAVEYRRPEFDWSEIAGGVK